jgi:formylglycine-generating enzyme required for sulfatase activity
MVLIAPQKFKMGEGEGARDVTITHGFYLDRTEVTTRAYEACVSKRQCSAADHVALAPGIDDRWGPPAEGDAGPTAAMLSEYADVWTRRCNASRGGADDHPINCVDFASAEAYCKFAGKRLPTEAEWEYATRGPDGRIYPWGDEAPTAQHLNACGTECLAWAKQNKVASQFPGALYEADDGYATTAPVGKFPAGRSRFGPYDVVGNVWEWVADWEGPYQAEDQKNPTGPDTGQKRIIRGGAWNGSYPEWLHPSYRYAQDPKSQSHGVGFRCAKSP